MTTHIYVMIRWIFEWNYYGWILAQLKNHLIEMSSDKYASNVVENFLVNSEENHSNQIIMKWNCSFLLILLLLFSLILFVTMWFKSLVFFSGKYSPPFSILNSYVFFFNSLTLTIDLSKFFFSGIWIPTEDLWYMKESNVKTMVY